MLENKDYKFDIEALPLNWYYFGDRLKDTAELIIKHSTYEVNRFPYFNAGKTLSDQFFLNYGFAIENVIKGYLISEDKNLTKGYFLSHDISKNHDLVNLVKTIKKIQLTVQDKKILKILSDCITFWGRYPIAKRSDVKFETLEYSEEIHFQVKGLYFKFIKALYDNIKDGWENVNGLNSGTFRDSIFDDLSDVNNIEIESGNIKF
ncbi:hypothetical protein [Flavobacterium sp. C3NV]|uniref:hypothetical protein n=1 Tax=Flavobacterium sp. C3NV TaxID=3393358 RepID=UPI0039902EC2